MVLSKALPLVEGPGLEALGVGSALQVWAGWAAGDQRCSVQASQCSNFSGMADFCYRCPLQCTIPEPHRMHAGCMYWLPGAAAQQCVLKAAAAAVPLACGRPLG